MIWNMASCEWGFRFGISARTRRFKRSRFKGSRSYDSMEGFAVVPMVFGLFRITAMNIKKLLLGFYLLVGFSVRERRGFAQTTNLRIAFNGYGGIVPLFLGQDAGIFKKQNLQLEMIFIPGGSLSLQALIGKSLELLIDRRAAGGQCLFARRQDQNHRRRDESFALHFRCDGGHS